MKELDKNQVGLIVGAFFGLTHLIWSILVAIGLAQTLMDFVYSLHFLNNPFTVESFNFVKAATLVIITFVVGYILGFVFTAIWNMMLKRK